MYKQYQCKVCGGPFQVESGTFGPLACPHCNATVPIFPNRDLSHDRFTFTSVTPHFVSKHTPTPPVGQVDPSLSTLGKRLCLDMIAGKRDFGLPINGAEHRHVNPETDFNLAKEKQSSEAGKALLAIPIAIGLFFLHPFCGLILLLAAGVTLFNVSNEQTDLSSKLALAMHLGGVLEQGRIYTIVPEHRLLLGFEWVDVKVQMITCQRIPEQHMLVVAVETTYHGENSTPLYHNTTFVTATDGSCAYPLMFHGGINSQRGAESRLAKEPWRAFLNGSVILDPT